MQRVLSCILSVSFLLVFSSCSEDLLFEPPLSADLSVEHHDYLTALASMGIQPYSLEEQDGHVLVDKDVMFEASYLLQRKEQLFNKAIVLTNVVSYQNVRNIDFFIRPNAFTNQQKGLIRAATQRWEAISDCAINFREVTSFKSADLVITNQSDSSLPSAMQDASAFGVAWFPENGKVGRWIAIATQESAVQNATDDQFRLLVQHEIGHTLGYTHANIASNVPLRTVGQNDNNFNKIQLLCTDPPTSGNLMDSGGNANLANLNELSSDEELASHKLYPGYFAGPHITSHNVLYSGSNRYVKFTMNTGNDDPVKVKVERYHPWITSSPAGVSGIYLLENCGNSGRHVTVPTPTGYWNYRIKVGNFEGDYFGAPSAPYPINVN